MKKVFLIKQEFFRLLTISLKSSKSYTILRFILPIIESCIIIIISYIGKLIIDNLTSYNYKQAEIYVLLFTSIQIGNLFISKYHHYITMMHNDLITNSIKKELMSITLNLDIQWYDDPKIQDDFSKIQSDIFELTNLIWSVFDLIRSSISLTISILIFSNINVFVGLLIILTSIPVAISDKKYANTIFYWQKNNMNTIRKLSYIQNISYDKYFSEEVRLYNLSNKIKNKYDEIWFPYYKEKKSLFSRKTLNNSIFTSFPHFFVSILMLILIIKISNGTATIGDYSFYSNIVYQIIVSVSSIVGNYTSLYENRLIVENLNDFNSMNPQKIISGTENINEFISLEFKNVSFIYPNTDKKVLDNISFKINQGEKIVLVGVNGSGKTTIIKLMLRFYDVTSGEILINGKNIKGYSICSLRKLYSVLFQNYVYYSFTLRENINLFDNEEKDDSKIYNILERINADSILKKADQGLSSNLTKTFDDNGIELSGGEFQKLALCKAIYSNGKVILLDEPTAALDPESENELLKYIQELQKDKTTLLVSHRLSNINFANRILLIENGKVLEDGTHKELMKKRGRYYKLYMYQAEKYEII